MTAISGLPLAYPIIQAPMAGVSTPELAIAVSNAGALGSISVGASDVTGARAMVTAVRAGTDRPFNVNLFTHATPQADSVQEAAWLAALAPEFARFGAAPPDRLRPAYTSFLDDPAMQQLIITLAPPVVSFHFGLPPAPIVAALKHSGCALMASVTSLAEAQACARAGVDAVIAQGIEAGGHRGMFDPHAPDAGLGTAALVRLLVAEQGLPVIAAGGIMDGAGIRTMRDNGAVAAQLGTAFIACPESQADAAYRAALKGAGAAHTRLTCAVTGRPARSLPTAFTAWEERAAIGLTPPDYPLAYDAGKALAAAALARGEAGYKAQWAGVGAPQSRAMPAATLVATLVREAGFGRGCRRIKHRKP